MPDLIPRLRALELTREYLARELGVTLSTLYRWLSGQSRPSRLAQKRINEYLSERDEQGGK